MKLYSIINLGWLLTPCMLMGQAQVPAAPVQMNTPGFPTVNAIEVPVKGPGGIQLGTYAPLGEHPGLSCTSTTLAAQLDTTKQNLAMILDDQSLTAFLRDEDTKNPVIQLRRRISTIRVYIAEMKRNAEPQ